MPSPEMQAGAAAFAGPFPLHPAGRRAALGLTRRAGLRDAGARMPACHMSLCPWADLTNGAASLDDPAVADPNPELRPLAEAMAEHYLQGADPRDPLASPLFADLAGL